MFSHVGLAVEGLTVVAAVGGVVDQDVLDVGVGGGRLLGRRGQGEADGHDGVAALADQALQVGAVVVLAVGLDGLELHAELVGGLLGALEAELVERLVVEPTGVGHDARQEVAGGRGAVAAAPGVVSSSGASPHAARVAAASSATRPLETTFLVFNTNASKFVHPRVGSAFGSMMPAGAHPVTRFRTSEMRLRHKSRRTTFGGTCQRPPVRGMRHSGRLQEKVE